MITQKYQPFGSNLCGQTCVAMLCNVSIERACEIIGKKGATSTKDLVRALESQGYAMSPRAVRLKPYAVPPDNAILKYRSKKQRLGHWVLRWHGERFDPVGNANSVALHPDWKITSYIQIIGCYVQGPRG